MSCMQTSMNLITTYILDDNRMCSLILPPEYGSYEKILETLAKISAIVIEEKKAAQEKAAKEAEEKKDVPEETSEEAKIEEIQEAQEIEPTAV